MLTVAPGPMEGSGRAPRQQLLRQGGEEVVDWSQVDAEVKSVPSEYREARFHPLKHVVEVFSSADPQGLTQDLRVASERLGAQLDAVVSAYHVGFARSIQNYSQILEQFHEAKDQVESLKRSLADSAKQLGAHSKFMNAQWRKSLSLQSSLQLLADIRAVVEIPTRVDAALAERDWPRAVSCLLEGATLLAHDELRQCGALRKLRSDFATLAGWVQGTMVEELAARVYSSAPVHALAAPSAAAAAAVAASAHLGATGRSTIGLANGGGRSAWAQKGGQGAAGGKPMEPGWRSTRKAAEPPAYKLVTETLHASRTTSTEVRSALSLASSGSAAPGALTQQLPSTYGAEKKGIGSKGTTQLPVGAESTAAGGPAVGGGDVSVEVDLAMRRVSTRDLVACLAQVNGVGEAKLHLAQRARAEMRALVRRSLQSYGQATAASAVDGGRNEAAARADVLALGSGWGGTAGATVSPALRVLSSRLITHVSNGCLQALGRLQHVLVELAGAPATTQSSALDVIVEASREKRLGTGLNLGRGPGLLDDGPGAFGLAKKKAAPGGGLTSRERAAYLREEYQRVWDCMQEEVQLLLADLLQVATRVPYQAPARKPGHGAGPGGAEAGESGAGGGGAAGIGASVPVIGGVLSALSGAVLNPVHFLEQLATLAEKTADLAESALGGGPAPSAGVRPPGQLGPAAGGGQAEYQQASLPPAVRRRRELGSKLAFGFDVTVPGVGGDQAPGGSAAGPLRDQDAAGYGQLVTRTLGDRPGSLALLPDVFLPVLRMVERAQEVLHLPPDLAPGAPEKQPPVVVSWLPRMLEEVALEQFLPQLWVQLRGRCTAALEDADAFSPQVGFSAAAHSAADGLGADRPTPASLPSAADGVASLWSTAAPRAVVPLARFLEGVLRELVWCAGALPPFSSAFLAIAERILDRMLGAFTHVVRVVTYGLASCRLVSRSDVCLAMASETDALLLREPVAFAPQPNALPAAMLGGGPGASGSGGSSPADLVAFMVALRSQERPLLVPTQLRPLGTAGAGGAGRGPVAGFGADGSAAELELQYVAMRERPMGHEQLLLLSQGTASPAVQLAALSESLDFVADAVVHLVAEGGVAGGPGGTPHGPRASGRRGARGVQGTAVANTATVPDILQPVVQSYKALAGHCSRVLRLEALLLVGAHLAPVAAASHVCEEADMHEMHPSLGALTRAALRCSEELTPFLQPCKLAYIFGPLAAAAARGTMWLLPAIQEINGLGVERMTRALSLLQPLTSLVTIAAPSASAGSAQAGPAAPSVSRSSQQLAAAAVIGPEAAAAVAAAAAAAAAAAVPGTSGYGAPSATALAALLLHPETRGDRGGAFDAARSFYALLIVPVDSVLAALNDRPGRFLYAEWMALLQARVPHRTVTDVALSQAQRVLDRAYGLTPGAKMAGVVGAMVAPAERLGDALLEGLAAGKDTVVDVLLAGKDTLVAGMRVPAQTLQKVFKRIGGAAVDRVRAGRARRRQGVGGGFGEDAGDDVE